MECSDNIMFCCSQYNLQWYYKDDGDIDNKKSGMWQHNGDSAAALKDLPDKLVL